MSRQPAGEKRKTSVGAGRRYYFFSLEQKGDLQKSTPLSNRGVWAEGVKCGGRGKVSLTPVYPQYPRLLEVCETDRENRGVEEFSKGVRLAKSGQNLKNCMEILMNRR